MPTISVPAYDGGSVVNLSATIEARLGGTPPSAGLRPEPAELVPPADGYVVALFDGLGSMQLGHPAARELAADRAADLDTVFPATTTVALASLTTGLAPISHGLLGYQLWLPELDRVANTIKWTTLWGAPLDYDTATLLPAPNLWERLASVGVEGITVQPAHFEGSPLTRALYRGARFEPASTVDELVTATAALAGPRRLVLTYLPHVDFAAHVHGQRAVEYERALAVVAGAWQALRDALPPGIGLIGTSDHGHVDFPRRRQIKIPKADHAGRVFYGDGRAMFVKGDGEELSRSLPATWVPLDACRRWWGSAPAHPASAERLPDGILLADDDVLLLHRFSDDRMVGNHGAMTPGERRVPLLVSPGG